jgi:hypothetical protein
MVTAEMRREKFAFELGHEDRADFNPRAPFANRPAFERDYHSTHRSMNGRASVPFGAKAEFRMVLGLGNTRWVAGPIWAYSLVALAPDNQKQLESIGVVFLP